MLGKSGFTTLIKDFDNIPTRKINKVIVEKAKILLGSCQLCSTSLCGRQSVEVYL